MASVKCGMINFNICPRIKFIAIEYSLPKSNDLTISFDQNEVNGLIAFD